MESRSKILGAVKANKPPVSELPSLRTLERSTVVNPVEAFKDIVHAIGGQVEEVDYEEIQETIARLFPDAEHTASGTEAFQGSISVDAVDDPKALENLDVFVCRGTLGVAENGAIWVPEHLMVHRVAPFITQHLVVLLKKSTIVADMHAAYEEIDVAEEGFGVFIAGPSKTADIEQSLVLGAHGPRSMTVLLF